MAAPEITTEPEGDVLSIRATGKDFVVEQARAVVHAAFEAWPVPPRNILLDLGPVTYINSSGISVIIRLNLERRLVIVGASNFVREIFAMTGISGVLRIAGSRADGLALLRGTQALPPGQAGR